MGDVADYQVDIHWLEQFRGEAYWEWLLFSSLLAQHADCCELVGATTRWDGGTLHVRCWWQ